MAADPAHVIAGKRILLLEDEPLIAMTIADMIEDLDAVVLGPVASVDAALALIDREPPDAAVLDVNLGGERSDAVAERLQADGVPYLLATGYGPSAAAPGIPVLEKPLLESRFTAALVQLLS